MYAKVDTTKAPLDSIYVENVGMEHHLVYEYDNEKVDFIFTDEQFNKIMTSILKKCGYKSYQELEDELDRAKAKNEEHEYQKALDEEHQDILREKYYQPF